MSGSDHLTTAYLSKESSLKTLSTTLADGATNGDQTPIHVDVGMHPLNKDVAGAEKRMTPPSRAPTAEPTGDMIERTSEEERFLDVELPATSAGHHHCPSPVVDRGDISIADISIMRLEGCRTHRLSPNASLHGSVCEGMPAAVPSPSLRPRGGSTASSRQAESRDAAACVSVASGGPERSPQSRSGAVSPGANALDTSVAILQHMAMDTAARVGATRSGQAPSELLSVGPPSNKSPPPSTLATLHRTTVPTGPMTESLEREDATDPIGFAQDSDLGQPHSQLHTGSTRPYRRSSASSNSPLHSLSESELCGAGVHPLGASRNVSAQALGQLAELADEAAAEVSGAAAGHAGRYPESPDGARRRLRLVGAMAGGQGEDGSRVEAASTAAAAAAPPLCTPPVPLDTAQRTIDATVYNHDFQRIISHEVKEALTRNMRPSVDDDEDEDETLLNDVLSGQASPALMPVQRRSSVHMNESRNCTFAPFQLPMGATSIGRLDSIVGTPSIDPGARGLRGFPEHAAAAARQPLSLSTAALEGDALASSGAATSLATRGGKGANPRTVSAQAWRFPTLGRDSAVVSPAQRRTSLEEEEGEGEGEGVDGHPAATATTTGTVPGAASTSRRTHRTAAPASCYSSDNPTGPMTPISGSWRHRRESDSSSAGRVRSRPASGNAEARSAAALQGSTDPASSVAKGSSLAAGAGGSRGLEPAPERSVGATSVMRFEDGRLFTQPLVSAHSSSSLPGSGGVPDDSYPRKLEMMHTVYERLAQQRRNAPTPKAMKALVAKRPSHGALENFPVTPQAPPRASASVTAVTAAVVAPVETAPSSAVSSRARRSLSLSCSGALGRSAGYYSFGTRVSLSHPNRQALPQQYLGSCSNLPHGTPSASTTVLGSPAVVDLVAVSRGGAGSGAGGVSAKFSSAPESSLTHVTSSGARVPRRSLNSELVRRIEGRPLLQSTLFLKHTLRAIREAHGTQPRPSDTSKDSTTMSQLVLSGATAVPSGHYDLSKFNDSSTMCPAVCASGHEYLASMATPLGSATNIASEDPELSSRNTRGPSSGSSGSSIMDKAAVNHKGGAAEAILGEAARSTLPETTRVHVDPAMGYVNNAACAAADVSLAEQQEPPQQPQQDPFSSAAQGQPPQRSEDAGTTAQRYYRALTDAEQRVRHVHGVDGVEREVDNESMDLIVYVGMRLMGWLEVVSLLGCGSFGQVFLCKDLRICDGHFVHPGEIGGVDYEYWNCSHAFLPFSSVDIAPTNPPLVAVKVVKSVPLLEQQSVLEAEMLVLIGAQTAATAPALESSSSAPPPEDPRCASVAKVLADGICYGHHCIIMERYGANLYEYIASNEHLGLPMYQIRSIGAQLFTALSLIHEECHIIHADIKPENMLLTLNSSRGVVRTNEAQGMSAAAGAAGASTSIDAAAARSPDARAPATEDAPARHVPRCEDSTTCSPERSYITLRTGPTTAAGRHRHGQLSRKSSAVPLDASVSAMGRSRGQSFLHLRSSATSRVTVVEPTTVPAPEPRRVQSLNQSAGMLASRPSLMGPLVTVLPTTASAKAAAAAAAAASSSMIPRLHVKLIDFSSSCYDGGPFYQYIQSRYYRAPEVVVGASYGSGIDMWSSGCLLAELLLGMPLLPGCNDHHQLCLIEEMVGPLPTSMVQEGSNMELYYQHVRPEDAAAAAPTQLTHPAPAAADAAAAAPPPPPRPFALRTREEYLHITQSEPQPYRRYFTYQTLQELVRHCPLTLEERRMSNGLQPYVPVNESSEIPANATPSPSVRSEMMKQRFLLFDLLRKLLQTDPKQRPTASQALAHPFFTSAPPYMKTFTLE